MNAALIYSRQQWHRQHLHCADEVEPRSIEEARYVITSHATHGPACLQYLVASAFSSGAGDDDDV